MLEINAIYPDEEDLTEAFNREMAVLRTTVGNLETLFKRILENQKFVDEEVVAQLLHCKIDEIPMKLIKYRPSRAGYVYKLSEVYEFIESKKIGGK